MTFVREPEPNIPPIDWGRGVKIGDLVQVNNRSFHACFKGEVGMIVEAYSFSGHDWFVYLPAHEKRRTFHRRELNLQA